MRDATKENILEYLKQKLRRFTELKDYMENDIEEFGINPLSNPKFIKFLCELKEEGKIYSHNGLHMVLHPSTK